MTNRIWKLLTAASMIACLGVALSQPGSTNSGGSQFTSTAHAGGVTVAAEDAEVVFTASEDGKTVYMWQYYSSKPPKYIGKAEAVLNQ